MFLALLLLLSGQSSLPVSKNPNGGAGLQPARSIGANPSASELAGGAYAVPAHEFRFIDAPVNDWPATLVCSMEVLRGAPVSVDFLTRRDLNLFIRGQQPRALLVLDARKTARFRQAVPTRGNYDIVLINDSDEDSEVRIEALITHDRDLAHYVSAQRKTAVILVSLLVFAGTVTWSAVSLVRAMRRRRASVTT